MSLNSWPLGVPVILSPSDLQVLIPCLGTEQHSNLADDLTHALLRQVISLSDARVGGGPIRQILKSDTRCSTATKCIAYRVSRTTGIALCRWRSADTPRDVIEPDRERTRRAHPPLGNFHKAPNHLSFDRHIDHAAGCNRSDDGVPCLRPHVCGPLGPSDVILRWAVVQAIGASNPQRGRTA